MIKLSQIRDALYDVDIESSCYFNIKTNEILWHWGFNEEDSTYKEDDENNEDIIRMFVFYTKSDYDIMQEFISSLGDDSIKNELFNATHGKGTFTRFRTITDNYNITDDWYKYRDDEYKRIAKEWCINNKIEYEKDC